VQHGLEPKPHLHIPNLTSRPKLSPNFMMASSNLTLQVLIHVGFIIMLASSNHLATSVLTIFPNLMKTNKCVLSCTI